MALFGRPVALLVAGCLATAAAAPAQSPKGELRIRIRDASGAPVVSSGSVTNGPAGLRRSFRTDEQGSATLAALEPGPYVLTVTKDGFAAYTARVEVTASQPVSHEARLEVGLAAYAVSVTSATPLAGLDRALDEIPAPTQAATSRDLEASGALDLSSFMNRRLNNIYLNEIQGNPMQPDLNYRGYTASPLLGTPQGVSIYLDGVRLNQPFGDVVSWDLIPRFAVAEMTLVPGSNPLFGLNTLGGSVSIRTKDGIDHAGTGLRVQGGSFARKMADFEHGGSAVNGFNWFLGASLLFEDGWRESSPSNVRQFFGKFGSQRERTAAALTLGYANNALIGNGLQDERLLGRDFASVYTKPDLTANRAPFLNLNLRRSLNSNVSFSGNAYFRYIRTRTLNGDINEDSLDQSVYQPNAAEQAALRAAGLSGFPAAGENAVNTPFPRWRCIANALRRDEPAEKCNGLLNRSGTHQRNYGLSGQVTWFARGGARNRNQLTVGAGYDGNRVGFTQSSELGYLNADRSVTGVGAFADGVTGGDVDGEPFDTRADLSGRIHSGSLYATDTVTVADRLNLTFSGRLSRTTIDNRDRLRPLPGTGSLTGKHIFTRFNPAAGATFRLSALATVYGSYTEGNRAPTSIELGCADPAAPCRLPNALAGDPPLEQVRTRTFEAGVRGAGENRLRWSAGWFHAANRDDILFVASEQTGFGHFKNFQKTRRRGLELDAALRVKRATLGGGYTFLDATFQSEEEVNGTGNSSNEEAQDGTPGTEGTIEIEPGNRMPLTPRHMAKAWVDLQVTAKFVLNAGVVGVSSSLARGNENGRHQPDGRYYLGQGSSPGYAVVNLGGRYDLHRRLHLFAQVNNLFDRRFYTGAQLGVSGFTAAAGFIARPFPAINGEFPLQGVTFLAPGAPRAAWVGLGVRF